MRALDPEIANVIWVAIEALLPTRKDTHPLGCHRQRKSDRDCFDVMLVRLATGCSFEDAERLCGHKVLGHHSTSTKERVDRSRGL